MAIEILETWKPVCGYEGEYEVSDLGRVKSLARVIRHSLSDKRIKERLLKPGNTTAGYPTVSLHLNGAAKTHYVHVMVLCAFVGPRPSGTEACHQNGDPGDPRLLNLRWDTPTGNQRDKVEHGTTNRGERQARALLTRAQAIAIASDPRPASKIAAEFSVHVQTVYSVKSGGTWAWATGLPQLPRSRRP